MAYLEGMVDNMAGIFRSVSNVQNSSFSPTIVLYQDKSLVFLFLLYKVGVTDGAHLKVFFFFICFFLRSLFQEVV